MKPKKKRKKWKTSKIQFKKWCKLNNRLFWNRFFKKLVKEKSPRHYNNIFNYCMKIRTL